MTRAYDLRRAARNSLRGKWGIAVLAGFLATLLGGTSSSLSLDIEVKGSGDSTASSIQGIDLSNYVDQELVTTILTAVTAVAAFFALVYLFVGSAVEIGYCRFNMDLIDGQRPKAGTLFSYFNIYGTAVAARLLRYIFVFLWSLLFVIPGIMASYSYSMTGYILADNPEFGARQAISMSKSMMRGNRWRLFCLQLSFIGWALLNVFTLGIGSLWLVPYTQAATAAFYRELSGAYSSDAVSV